MTDPDPATVEIVRNQLLDVAEEMQATVMNSAYSPLWQEAGDLSCGLLSSDYEIVGQAKRAIALHIATMTNTVERAVADTGGVENLSPGDVLLQNDPYSGNNHLPDFLVTQPVFVDDRLIGFSAVRGHWVDVGGIAPTSYALDTGDIIKEGLRVPPAKLYVEGERNDALYDVILANVRGRDERAGDLNAQLAGVRRGKQRLEALTEKHGAKTVKRVMDVLLANDEERMRSRIRALPDGSWRAEDFMDGDGVVDSLIGIRAELTVEGDRMVVDFAGTDEQVAGGINAPFSCTESGTYYAVKTTLDPGEPGSTGAYRPVDVVAPPGTLVNPNHPAPVVAGNHETTYRIFDTVLKAIAEMDPELGYAAGEGGANVLNYQSVRAGDLNYTVMGGGWGALRDRDGLNAKRSGPGNTGIQPVERLEEDYPYVTIEERSIVADTGGAGRHRGGCTSRRVIRFDDEVEVLLASERAKTTPFGVAGGADGARARHVHVTPDGEEVELPSKISTRLEAGSRLLVQPAGGGGYGSPTRRPPEAVLQDVRDGYVSAECARDGYGVAIDTGSMSVDDEATERLRRE